MPRGRPPGVALDPNQDRDLRIDVAGVDIDQSGLLSIPTRITSAVGWLPRKSTQDVLAVLPRPGVVQLYAWSPHGIDVVKKKSELEARLETDPDAQAILTQLTLRYRRLVVRKDFETNLALDLRLHLGVRTPGPSRIYVMQVAEHIEFLAKDVLESRLGDEHDDLANLP